MEKGEQGEGLYPSLTPLLPSGIRSLRGGVAGEGIWWRHLRTSAGGGGKGRRAGTGCRNRSPRPLVTDPISGLAPALGKPWSRASLQRVRGQLQLKFLSVFWTVSAPSGRTDCRSGHWAQRERPPTCTYAGWSHLPSTQEQAVGPYPRKKRSFLGEPPWCWGGNPEPNPLPGSQAREQFPSASGRGL